MIFEEYKNQTERDEYIEKCRNERFELTTNGRKKPGEIWQNTEEGFLEACRKNGLDSNWGTFTEDSSFPVYVIKGNHINKNGRRDYEFRMQGNDSSEILYDDKKWIQMTMHLIVYRDKYMRENTKENIRISKMVINTSESHFAKSGKGFPYVTLWTTDLDSRPVEQLLNEGWTVGSYDRYMGATNYYKDADLRDLLTDIVIEYQKKIYSSGENNYTTEYKRFRIKDSFSERLTDEIALNRYDSNDFTSPEWEKEKRVTNTYLIREILSKVMPEVKYTIDF